MRNKKPLLTIDKFSGSGQNGILYCEGFYPEIDNQKSIMSEGFYTSNLFTNATTGLDGLATVKHILPLSTINNSSALYQLYYNGYNLFSYSEIYSLNIKTARIHTTLDSIQDGNLIETSLGNILYPSQSKIGRGVRFKATGGSTTTIIDTTKNFVTLGYAANDKVTNLKTGIEYTITSITSGSGTNDVLNFTASGTNTTAANDEIIVWEDDRFDTNLTPANWQQTQPYWTKQIKQYGDIYYFTNGNYLGKISGDESTVTANFKQLFAKHQALCLGINNSKILVSANFNGRGALLLWDGYSDGWNNSLSFDIPITALTQYQSGWIFVSNGDVYYTDGYQIQNLYTDNSTRKISQSFNPSSCNGLAIYENMLYCANTQYDNNFIEKGVYAVDLSNVNNGFTLIKCKTAARNNGAPYCVSIVNRFGGTSSIQVGGEYFCSSISYGNSGGQYLDKSFIISVPLPDQQKITGIGLNLSRYLKSYNNDLTNAKSRIVQVSVGDGNRGLIGYVQATTYYGTSIIVNGTTYLNNEIGDEIFSIDSCYGDRAFITNIVDKGGTGENWTVSPAVTTAAPASQELKMLKVKSCGKKTIAYNNLKDEFIFNLQNALFTNKLFIEVVFFGQDNPLPLNINEINIYGE